MKLTSTLLYFFILTTLTRCGAMKTLYDSLTNESGNTPNNIIFLGALTSSNQGQNNCATPSTTPSIGGGTFSKAQEISFYSSCKYYKTFYEVNGHKSANYIGSNSIQIPNGELNPGVVSVVKLKYWSECYNDQGNTSKCSESETPKLAEYIFDTEAPTVELLSKNIFYLSNIANNSKATIQFKVSQSGDNEEKEYSFEVIGEASKILNSGTAIANVATSFPLYASSLHVGENKLKLNVYDSVKNKSEVLLTVFLDDTLPNLMPNRSSGLYGSDINIEFASATAEPFIGNICYTTNGTEPEMFAFDPESSLTNGNICKNGTVFTNKIKIDKDATLKYIARELSGNTSSVRTLSYSIDPNRPTVIIQPISNPYTKSTASVPLKFSSDKAGRYLIQTTDGTGENKTDPVTGETKFYFKAKDIASGIVADNQEISLSILGQDLYNGQNLLMVSVTVEKEVEVSADTVKQEFTGFSQVDVYRDDIPPVSSMEPGQKETIYNTAIVARISTEDNAKSYYSINNGPEQAFNSSIGINLDITSIIKYYSVDRAGNKETPKTITYNIDTIPPIVTISDIKPVDKRISMTLASLSRVLEFGVKSNELGRFEVLKGGCDGVKLITRSLEGSKVVPDFSANDFVEGYSALSICVYDKAGNVTQKSLSNIFRDEKGDFAEVIDGNTNEVFKDFRAWEMPGDKPESEGGNNVLILTQGIVWMFDIRTEIDVPDICGIQGDPPSLVCTYKKGKVPTELQAKFTVPSDINEIATANKANYSRIIYLAYPLGLRIEDRSDAIRNTYLKERLSATQLKADNVDWVGLSEGTLVNLELINKFKDISRKRIFIAAPFKGSIYRDALAQGILGNETWALFKDAILKNAPEISQLLESSDYSKNRAPQLLTSLLLGEDKGKSFLIPTNYKNLGIDLVVSIDSQTAGTPSPFDSNNIAVVAGSHFEMGNAPTKDSIRLVVNSILQNGKIPSEINGDLAKNQVPVNYINGKWIAPINGSGGQEGTFTLEPNAGKVEMKILYDNPDWKVDSTIVVDSNTYKNGFIEVSTDLFILKKDVNAQIKGPFKLELVFDMERFKKSTNFSNRHPDFKEYPIFLYFAPKTNRACIGLFFGQQMCFDAPEPWQLTTFPSLNVPVYINDFKLGFKDKIDFLISMGMYGNFYHKERPCILFACWDVEWRINGWSTLNFQYDKGKPNLSGSITMDFWGLGIDNMDFTGHIRQKTSDARSKTFFLDVPDSLEAGLLFIKFPIDIRPVEDMNLTLPVLDQNGEPKK